MKHGWLILFLLPCAALAQWAGKGSVNGVSFRYETKLEPAAPSISSVCGGLLVEHHSVAKRHLCDFASGRFYGYDLSFDPMGADTYKLKLAALSMTARQMEELFANKGGWSHVPFAHPPAAQMVRPGDTVAMDLFVNPATGQKIVEYITVLRDERMRAEAKKAGPLVIHMQDGSQLHPVEGGKVCAVLFMLTTCEHCGPAAEMMSRLQLEFGTRALKVSGAALNEGLHIALYVRDRGLSYPVGTARNSEMWRFLGITGGRFYVPVLALVDQHGYLLYQWQGDRFPSEEDLRKTIHGLLNAR
ncbi:MAG: hypothetical protein HY820_28785 [Acidobacteria bacterium]|nr:hypothetical protein [Acidobacteriota bacterium]